MKGRKTKTCITQNSNPGVAGPARGCVAAGDSASLQDQSLLTPGPHTDAQSASGKTIKPP